MRYLGYLERKNEGLVFSAFYQFLFCQFFLFKIGSHTQLRNITIQIVYENCIFLSDFLKISYVVKQKDINFNGYVKVVLKALL